MSVPSSPATPPVTKASTPPSQPILKAYWALDAAAVAKGLGCTWNGLSAAEAARRLHQYGPNEVREQHRLSRLKVLGHQLNSPLLLLLVFAAAGSAFTGDWIDAVIVEAIIIATVAVGYSREYSAQKAMAALGTRLRPHATVMRDGHSVQVPTEEVVPGDVVLLSAGSLVPADAILLEASNLFVSQAALTGESFPVQKQPGVVDTSAELVQRTNCVFDGTDVRSGTARCLVVATGRSTEIGAITHQLTVRPPETEFDRGIRNLGYLLTRAMLILVLVIFAVHLAHGRPALETLLFAVSLAVGLSPELMPVILNVNLSRGAQMMAQSGVLVRHLNSIENLGSMDVLCTDKTGTITEGVVELEGGYDASGRASDEVLELGALNAALETGIASPLDEAITKARKPDLTRVHKLGEIPFDFVRKRTTVVLENAGGARLVTIGAFEPVLGICSLTADGTTLTTARRGELEHRYEEWTGQGIRVLGVAVRSVDVKPAYTRDDERDMTFKGFLTFLDRPKQGVKETIAQLAALGVSIKIITGDSQLVTQHIATLVGLRADRVLTGRQLNDLQDEALRAVADKTDLFAEVDPNQKERIILSLKKAGHVVGFIGDGVNDAPAMHDADTSLAVDSAVDVAREAADFVLLKRGLDVIRRGIEEGRKTFANTIKYVLMTTSANLGNMVSLAAASLFLPFLPMTSAQILLENFLSDIPAVGIADDAVDPELVARPRRWNIRFIDRFMVEFGLSSSLFDFLTFGALLTIFHAAPKVFQTAWFVESLLTELVVALVMRTIRPFYRSRPGTKLLKLTIALIVVALAIPYVPFARLFGFVPLSGAIMATIIAITMLYVTTTELQKKLFFRHFK